ncbi:MAG: aryl-sulfate sulfotransferase, partial [Candidatus Altiarchaeota archaeon]
MKIKRSHMLKASLALSLLILCLLVLDAILPTYTALDYPVCQTPESSGAVELRGLGYIDSMPVLKDDLMKDGVIYYDPNMSYHGFNLFSYSSSQVAYLIDMNGNMVYNWSLNVSHTIRHVELGPDGDIYVSTDHLYRFDRDSKLLLETSVESHHDLDLSEDGRIYTPSRFYKRWVFPHYLFFLNYCVLIIDSDGRVMDGILLFDRFWYKVPLTRYARIFQDLVMRRLHPTSDSPADIFHVNTVSVITRDVPGLAEKGDILVCLRDLDLIAILDGDTGDVVWGWGEGVLDRPHKPVLLD